MLCSIIFQALGLSMSTGHVVILGGAPGNFPWTAKLIFWKANS